MVLQGRVANKVYREAVRTGTSANISANLSFAGISRIQGRCYKNGLRAVSSQLMEHVFSRRFQWSMLLCPFRWSAMFFSERRAPLWRRENYSSCLPRLELERKLASRGLSCLMPKVRLPFQGIATGRDKKPSPAFSFCADAVRKNLPKVDSTTLNGIRNVWQRQIEQFHGLSAVKVRACVQSFSHPIVRCLVISSL